MMRSTLNSITLSSRMTSSTQRFADRRSAGLELAQALNALNLPPNLLILGLPRGGVPVAHEVARVLRAPLDVLVVRKIGMPGQHELAIGAIALSHVVVRDPTAISVSGITQEEFNQLVQRERVELRRRENAYRQGRGALELAARSIILIDDGLATGATMLAAVRAAREAGAASVIVAAPVASHEAVIMLRAEADEVVVLLQPPLFIAVGEWYEQFEQTGDAEVIDLLTQSAHTPQS
jgi:putative phosphoribosyl transferase